MDEFEELKRYIDKSYKEVKNNLHSIFPKIDKEKFKANINEEFDLVSWIDHLIRDTGFAGALYFIAYKLGVDNITTIKLTAAMLLLRIIMFVILQLTMSIAKSEVDKEEQ